MKVRAAWLILFSASVCFGQSGGGIAVQAGAPAERKAAPPVVSDESGVLTTRPVWPVDVPLYVSVNRRLFSDAARHELTLRAALPGAPVIKEQVFSQYQTVCPGPDLTWDDWIRLAGTPRTAADSVTFSLDVSNTQGKDSKSPARPDGPIKLPVQVKGSVDEILTATPLPDLDAALQNELNACFYRRGWNSKGSPRLWLGTYTNCEGAKNTEYPGICHVLAKHADVTFAVRVEVMHDGKAVASSSAWWRGDATYQSVHPYEGMLGPEILDTAFKKLNAKDGKWALHIVSAPEVALRDFESVRYWKGEVTVPVRVTDSSDWEELTANGEDKRP